MADEVPPEEMSDAQWREFVNRRLQAGNSRFDGLEASAMELRLGLAANTQLVAEVRSEVGDLRSKTLPIVDAMTTMEAGIRTIGRIGTLGAKLGKSVLVLLLAWVTLKFLFGGATWNEVVAAVRNIAHP